MVSRGKWTQVLRLVEVVQQLLALEGISCVRFNGYNSLSLKLQTRKQVRRHCLSTITQLEGQ